MDTKSKDKKRNCLEVSVQEQHTVIVTRREIYLQMILSVIGIALGITGIILSMR